MKVFIYEHYDTGIGGNQRYLMLLIERFAELYGNAVEVVLAVPSKGVFYQAVCQNDDVVALECKGLTSRVFALWRQIRSTKPDVILCHNEASLLTVLPAALARRIALIWHVKNLRRGGWSDFLCFLFARRVLAIAPQSLDVKSQRLVNWFRDKSYVQPIGTRLDEFSDINADTADSYGAGGSLRILAVMFVGEAKGTDTLIEALEWLDQHHVSVDVRIVGATAPGCERLAADLRARSDQLERVQVEWLGWRDDIRSMLEWTQVVVNPTRRDGVPRSIIEAMAAARPVIGSRIGGVPEAIVDGETGYLIEAGDAIGLAKKISKLADDAPTRQRFGQAARARALERYDIDQHVKRLKEHLDAVVEGG
ncbi:glycosyltransferase involved in cell wall biosynthesis [Tamilnaduibacter salinus]|uniref:Glycosyltransferase involved in cell wall biosynthesis n=1 Tax=Tamilnaduibacter salinus TaxID=1484056 RepID=A0A2U1CV24_9GAMM|nr:glycosyltransferase family 4 protein [Tamilnaduibacter salinus]PVY70821.1 glycosyltransferase involved in cell wall biosynthesis [Tamilnaduibacter salinus]